MQEVFLVANFEDDIRLTYETPDMESVDNLRNYVNHSIAKLTNLCLQFYDHIEKVTPDYPEAIYFSKSAECQMNGDGENLHSYVVGWVEGETLKVVKWKVPEILPFFTEDRKIPTDSPCLIWQRKD